MLKREIYILSGELHRIIYLSTECTYRYDTTRHLVSSSFEQKGYNRGYSLAHTDTGHIHACVSIAGHLSWFDGYDVDVALRAKTHVIKGGLF